MSQLCQSQLFELNYKKFEQDTVSLGYDIRTRHAISQGLLLSYFVCSFASARGWKKADNQWVAYIHQKLSDGDLSVKQAADAMRPPDFNTIPIPVKVKPMEHLLWNVRALSEIVKSNTAPKVCACAQQYCTF